MNPLGTKMSLLKISVWDLSVKFLKDVASCIELVLVLIQLIDVNMLF